MKRGNFAVFKGKEYSADYIKGKGIVLRSNDEADLDKGFEFEVVKEKEEEISIVAMTGDYRD